MPRHATSVDVYDTPDRSPEHRPMLFWVGRITALLLVLGLLAFLGFVIVSVYLQ